MFVNFENLSDNSKVWIYQSNRELSNNETEEINEILEQFVSTWKRHGDDLKASFQIKYNQFIIIAVDESYNSISGCSIDSSANVFKQIENKYHIDLFNKMNTAFKDGEHINIVTLSNFQKYVNDKKINSNTIVFNNMVQTKKELETAWEVKANESWHNRYF